MFLEARPPRRRPELRPVRRSRWERTWPPQAATFSFFIPDCVGGVSAGGQMRQDAATRSGRCGEAEERGCVGSLQRTQEKVGVDKIVTFRNILSLLVAGSVGACYTFWRALILESSQFEPKSIKTVTVLLQLGGLFQASNRAVRGCPPGRGRGGLLWSCVYFSTRVR